jgi:CRP-like cAMP-binding protein
VDTCCLSYSGQYVREMSFQQHQLSLYLDRLYCRTLRALNRRIVAVWTDGPQTVPALISPHRNVTRFLWKVAIQILK